MKNVRILKASREDKSIILVTEDCVKVRNMIKYLEEELGDYIRTKNLDEDINLLSGVQVVKTTREFVTEILSW